MERIEELVEQHGKSLREMRSRVQSSEARLMTHIEGMVKRIEALELKVNNPEWNVEPENIAPAMVAHQ